MRQFLVLHLEKGKGIITLHEQIRARVGRLAPFPHHVVETEVELVVSQQLSDESQSVSVCVYTRGRKVRIREPVTFSADSKAAPEGSWSDSV